MNLIYKKIELVASLIENNIVARRSIDAQLSKNACLTLKCTIKKREKQRQREKGKERVLDPSTTWSQQPSKEKINACA